jgi:hypothetical protein
MPLATLVPGIDPEIDEIIQRALKKEPNKRYQDAATFEKALERVRARMGPDDAPALPPPPAPLPVQSVGGKSRAGRAEAAYQRALEAARAGSRDAAKRFAVEALAEDPSHAGARAFLQGLEQRAPAATQAAPPRAPAAPAGATSVGTVLGTSQAGARTSGGRGSTAAGDGRTSGGGGGTLAGSGGTITGGGSTSAGSGRTSAGDGRTEVGDPGGTLGGRTAVGSSDGDATSTFASAPTLIVAPSKPKPQPAPNKFQALWGARKAAPPAKPPAREARAYAREAPPNKGNAPPAGRSSGSGRRSEPLWVQYRSAVLGAGIALGVALVAGLVWFIGRPPAGQLLTITKPEGGTLSAASIRCGTRGNDCSATRPNGDAIELTPQADAGYTFVGYTGDCAPGGRTIMSSARTCGATFTKDVTPPTTAGPTQTLTVTPPTGGTLEGVDILCGTKGSACSTNPPEGATVDLHPIADDGFTFMRFTGDCAPLGHTQMNTPRTCSATFSLISEVSKTPTLPAPVARGRSAGGGQVAQGQPPQQPVTPTPPVPVTPSPPRPAGRGPVVDPTQAAAKPVPPPQTDEEFAKDRIQEMMKAYCDAHEALDPDAVQKIYPRVNMNGLKQQLNTSKYRSVQCKFGEPLVYASLDAAAGKAVIKVPLKQTFFHTILTEKPDVSELMATMTLSRSGPRTPWLVEDLKYAPMVK